jgi:hypothetical protein
MADPLDVFRKTFKKPDTAQPDSMKPAPPSLAAAHEPYEAFGTKDKIVTLMISPSKGYSQLIAYSPMMRVSFDEYHWRRIFITASGITVKITGQRLRPIVDALRLHACEFIRVFNRDRFLEPTDETQPFVSSIDVKLIGESDPAKDNEDEKEPA